MTECHASGKLCPLGYNCKRSNEDSYTGVCVHRCDLETIDCKNDGHCIFDSMRNKTVCSCQSTWSSLYYGAGCEDQTGKLETVIGFTLGSALLLIVLVFMALLCCRRSHGGIKEFRRPGDKSTLESDFLSETDGVQFMDINYRKSTKFNPNSFDVDPVVKVMDTDQAGGNVSEILETSGCSTISSENSDNFSQEHKHRESSDSKVRQPGEEDSVCSTFVPSASPPAVTLEISRTSTETNPENRINHARKSFLFGP
ncbi:uncharacterized protein LOC134257295 isoform X1 [Saccostrea cucullata]|uniref:uncharacterized protein LOC134257295 isoform X1 n=1 Tax=Saccostrea cuccullata TaxID=36930 RepID=UPI002ED28DAB